ncbi:MAG: amino acid-binding protein [Verrucomicrobia bacterium]|jgi:hypothetical protein|nr:amino acid-binding protein [Verrucomicrobiota bacterium]
MNLIIERAYVWVAEIEDHPGGMLQVLKPLKDAGADLDLIITRRAVESPGKALVFVTPLRGERQVAAAAAAGFNVADAIPSLRVQGQNRPGLAADLAATLAEARLNLRGFSAAELGTRFVMYIGLDSEAEAIRAASLLQQQWGSTEAEWHMDAA